MSCARILLLDDNASFAGSLVRGLGTTFDVVAVTNVSDARIALDESTELVLLDIVLDERNPTERAGLEFLQWVASEWPGVPVVVLTGHGADEIEVEALRLGAVDYIEKEGLSVKHLRAKVQALLDRRRERLQNIELKTRLAEYEPHVLVGESSPISALRQTIQQIANSTATVFITGESGVGKEVVARALHLASPRREKPFIPVNCAALSSELLESELFGHEQDAYTSAHQRRVGVLERADGGTLLLDEVTEIDIALQSKLLRSLQEKQIRRFGSNDSTPVDVWIIATTNRGPEEAVRHGKLRQDLFYRLNVLRVEVPPLRHRADDIPLLVRHFLGSQRRRRAVSVDRFSSAAIDLLKSYAWPGNVRELKNIVERACALCRDSEVPSDLVAPWLVALLGASGISLSDDDLDIERRVALAQLQAIACALERTHRRKQEAQKLLGFSNRSTMRRTITRLQNNYPDLWSQFPIIAVSYGGRDEPKGDM